MCAGLEGPVNDGFHLSERKNAKLFIIFRSLRFSSAVVDLLHFPRGIPRFIASCLLRLTVYH